MDKATIKKARIKEIINEEVSKWMTETNDPVFLKKTLTETLDEVNKQVQVLQDAATYLVIRDGEVNQLDEVLSIIKRHNDYSDAIQKLINELE